MLVARAVAATATPGTGAPELSLTCPAMTPRDSWAWAGPANKTVSAAKRRNLDLMGPPRRRGPPASPETRGPVAVASRLIGRCLAWHASQRPARAHEEISLPDGALP